MDPGSQSSPSSTIPSEMFLDKWAASLNINGHRTTHCRKMPRIVPIDGAAFSHTPESLVDWFLTFCAPGDTIHEVSTARVFMTEQMFPTEQGEKDTSLLDVVGCIMYCALALHSDEDRGQQVPEREQPVVHYGIGIGQRDLGELYGSQLTSCMAPKLWPIS